MILWPWKITHEFVESMTWKTDVIRARGSEQRFALRPVPRIVYNFEHVFTEQEYNAAKSIVRKNDAYLVPDWSLSVVTGSVPSGVNVPVTYGEPYANLSAGDQVMLWDDNLDNEACVIDSVDGSNNLILSSVANTYINARVVPLHAAVAPEGLKPARTVNRLTEASISFLITDAIDIGYSSYPQYKSQDVITDCPIIARQKFKEDILWPVETADNDVSYPQYITQRNQYDADYQMRWHPFARADVYAVRRFLHTRKGRWKSFWLSSFVRDFELTGPISTADTVINVFAPGGVIDLGFSVFDLDIAGVKRLGVTSYAQGADFAGRTTLDLTLDAQVGANYTAGARLSYLRNLRFNADRIELKHAARSGTTITVPCIEL